MADADDSATTTLPSVPVPSESVDNTLKSPGSESWAGQHRRDPNICGQISHPFSNLCEKCKHIFEAWFHVLDAFDEGEVFAEYAHWDNVVLFEKSSSKGCHLCILFLGQFKEEELQEAHQALKHNGRDALHVTVLIDGGRSRRSAWGSWSLTLNLPLLDGMTTAVMAMSPTSHSNTTADESPPNDHSQGLSNSTWSDSSIALANYWLHTCRASHQKTCFRPAEAPNPTRLIAVNPQPRLVLSKDLPERVNYATLSHCWGSLEILRLLRSNFTRLQEGIPWYELCKTFQDACIVTRSLGFEYLWIDSLCIVQDDAKDWEHESIMMSTVYGCSSLNIAAANARDGSVGCFSSRYSKSIQKILICVKDTREQAFMSPTEQLNIPTAVPAPPNDQCEGKMYECAPQSLYRDCISDSPLGKRAWVLQERVLANRTLHFSSQLFWECKGNIACQTFPNYLPGIFLWNNQDLNTQDNSEHWFALIWLYSRCKLTFGKDKLIAIAGIAQSLEKRYSDQYLAGLWKRDLLRQLRWVVVYRTERPQANRAPSWSWASVDGGVHFRALTPRMNPLIEILYAHVVPVSHSIFGDIRSGVLRIRCGALVAFTITTYKKHSTPRYIINSGGHSFDCNMALSFDCKDVDLEKEYYLLSAWIAHCKEGFVLEATKHENGQYRRVGLFDGIPQNDDDRRVFKKLQDAVECLAPDSAYTASASDDEPRNKQYIITMV